MTITTNPKVLDFVTRAVLGLLVILGMAESFASLV